ncbi:hypothetical protein SAMN05444354_12366 [Stigmatella aurantiaca]|uniref:Lipoprotein n=2 Tax=Stigmatella aurantiaca TaxID=41 RepID=A0A1H8BAE7_STIAU|nr:hypothetical protein SAMN05444354_12366 [Stigmatella aurantiaca]
MKMTPLFQKVLLASSLSLLMGCGQTEEMSEDAVEQMSVAQTQEQELLRGLHTCEAEEVGELIEHSCYHAEYGPFVSVSAAAPGSTTLPNVNASHTAFNITLPQGTSFGYSGSVTFRPMESTEYAFLLSRLRGLKIYDGNTLIAQECSYLISESACGSLRRLLKADLEAGKVYRLEFQALLPENASFTLLVEEAAHDHEE